MVLINMSDEPEPVILTGVQDATLEISEDNDSNPGNNDFVIGFVLIVCSIPMFLALDEFCCLMGFLSLVSGFGFVFSANIKTYNWRKEKGIKRWTVGEVISVFFIGVILILILGTVIEFMMWY